MKRKRKIRKKIFFKNRKKSKSRKGTGRKWIEFFKVCLLACLLSMLVLCVKLFFSASGNMQEIREAEVTEDGVLQDYLTVNEYSRPGIPLKKVKGIVVHYVANPGSTAKENRDYFEGLSDTHTTKASSHFIIGLEGEIVQCIPLDEISYASNDRNSDTISIECCHPKEDGKFTKETYDALVSLVTKLCISYDIPVKEIIRHHDVTGKMCPIYYVKHPEAWKQFRKDVKKAIKTQENEEELQKMH